MFVIKHKATIYFAIGIVILLTIVLLCGHNGVETKEYAEQTIMDDAVNEMMDEISKKVEEHNAIVIERAIESAPFDYSGEDYPEGVLEAIEKERREALIEENIRAAEKYMSDMYMRDMMEQENYYDNYEPPAGAWVGRNPLR